MDAKRRQILTGTERLWGVATWWPSLMLALLYYVLFRPLLSPFEQGFEGEAIDFNHPVVMGLGFVLAVSAYFILRYHILKPILKLMRRINHRPRFWKYCRAVAWAGRWHVIILAFALLPFFFYFGEYVIWAQLGILLAVERWLEKRRDAEVRFLAKSLYDSGAVQ